MKRCNDKIQFESRVELGELIHMLEKYVDAYPKEKDNEVIQKLYNLLDAMELEW